MLPKKEKVPKVKNKDLNLELKNKKEDPAKKQHNRLFVITTLSLTTILCFTLIIYRHLKLSLNNGQSIIPKINITFPSINLTPVPSVDNLDSEISKIIFNTPGIWSIYGEVFPFGQTSITWSRNFDSLEASTLLQSVSRLKPSTTTTIAPYLPEGLLISELITPSPSFTAVYVIKIPNKSIFIAIKNPDQTEQIKQYVPQIVSTLYWDLISR